MFRADILILGIGALFTSCTVLRPAAPAPEAVTVQPADTTAPTKPPPQVTYQVVERPTSQIHVVTVPPDAPQQVHVVSKGALATLPTLAQETSAIAAINAGFFDPQNGLTTSFVAMAGEVVADPRQNPRLMGNPQLQAFLPLILNRSEFRIYDCEGSSRYDITVREAAVPQGCELSEAVGAGPQLLPSMTGYAEGFLADNAAGEVVRDAIGSQSRNARSAVGLKADGTVILVMASQLPDVEQPSGLTLSEVADVLTDLEVTQALNLDGGSSSGLYFEGNTVFGRLDAAGQPIERPIKSILLVR